MIEDHVTRPLVAMKPSHEFRRLTFAARLDWRTDCSRLGTIQPLQIKESLTEFIVHAALLRIGVAYVPIFSCLERIDTLLKSLKYVVVLALLLNGSQAGARYRHVHHPSVDRVRVYDPPRVEARDSSNQVASVFDTGFYRLRFPEFDVSRYVMSLPEVVPDSSCVSDVDVSHPTPLPAVESIPIPDNTDVYARMIISLGVMILLGALTYRVTGRYDDPAWQYNRFISRKEKVTLVETRWYLPVWVSAGYCHARHYLRLR